MRSDSFAGVERYLTYVTPELARRDHEVTVVGGDPERMKPVLGPAGVHHLVGNIAAQVAWAALRATRPDIVHTHMTAAELAAIATWPGVRRPMVTTRHFASPRGHGPLSRMAWSVIPRAMRREIATSEFVASRAGSPCVVIPNGVPDPSVPDREREPVVLVAQRFEAEKDTVTAIRAWALSGLGDEGWSLHLAGWGALEPTLVREAHILGVDATVRFLGHVPDLESHLVGAGMLLATTPTEALGLTVVEAMATSTPVLAAACGAHLETVGAAAEPALFPPGDARACADELRRLAHAPDARATLGGRLRVRYEAEYTIEHHVDRLEDLYLEVVEERRHGA